MTKVKFNYNIKKDAWSWALIAKDKNAWGLNWRDQIAQIPDKLLKKIEKVGFISAQKIIEDYIRKDSKKGYKNKVMQLEIQALEKLWIMIENKYFKILSKIMQQPVSENKFNCYITTGFMCPYNEKENWFMVSMWHNLSFQITTICHEIMHLQFLHYYKKYLEKKGLNNEQIENLKESLTFLLNEKEFESIILYQDDGYPEHQKLRRELKKLWDLNRNDFKSFLDKAIIKIK